MPRTHVSTMAAKMAQLHQIRGDFSKQKQRVQKLGSPKTGKITIGALLPPYFIPSHLRLT